MDGRLRLAHALPFALPLLLVGACDDAASEAPPRPRVGHGGAAMGDGLVLTEEPGEVTEPVVVCADGPTVPGVDVSKWQGSINWPAVAGDGQKFAFIRVSDGLGYIHAYYETNWQHAQDAGLIVGAYQYFRPGRDATEQANILLDRMGPLQADDLPPVLDVETMDGYSSTHVRTRIREWIERVESVTGLRPIIYTGYYFWRDEVGASAEWNDHPLWLAQYGRTCPTIPDQWSSWAFWQTSETGRVSGVSGGVDTNLFNGDSAALMALTRGGVVCGDGRCDTGEVESCPRGGPVCEAVPAEGAMIDETSLCFETGGPERYIRSVSEGYDDGLLWTYATSSSNAVVYGTWHLDFDLPGRYRVEAYTDGAWAGSREADYEVRHGRETDTVEVSQVAVDGWLELGVFDFDAGGEQYVYLPDNSGESGSLNRRIVYDAIRLTRLDPDDLEPEPEPPFESWIGGPCRDDADCLTGLCLDEARYGYPDGMCSERCDRYCPDAEGHPTTFCVTIEREGYCFSRESFEHYPESGCRPDYRSLSVPRHSQSSVRRDVCLPTVGDRVSAPLPDDEGAGFEPVLPDAVTNELPAAVEGGCSVVGGGAASPWIGLLLVTRLLRRRTP